MYSHGFLKIAVASPVVRAGDPLYNVKEMLKVLNETNEKKPGIVCFPEMAVPGYSIGDLVFQSYLYDDCLDAIDYFLENNSYDGVVIFGSFIVINDVIYNSSFVVQKNEILGIVPKNLLLNTNEFNEERWFMSGETLSEDVSTIEYLGQEVPFGKIIFESFDYDVTFGIDSCSCIWQSNSMTEELYANGAMIVFNPSASPASVGKKDDRRIFSRSISAGFNSAYVYVSNNGSESSSDVVFSGHKIIAENGEIISEYDDVTLNSSIIYGDIDIYKLHHFRRNDSNHKKSQYVNRDLNISRVGFELLEFDDFSFEKNIDILPFVPKNIDEYQEIIDIQAAAVVKRLNYIGINKVVLGVSGGLDSTLALLSLCYAYDKYGMDRKDILGYTLPSKATSDKTLSNSIQLMEKLGVSSREIPIYEAVKHQLKTIEHQEDNFDVTYENVQARYRTFTLMNLANQNGAIVIGTSDMSEVALGWSTFNGDQMAMYGMNAGIPKTVVKKVVEYYKKIYPEVSDILDSIIDTPISPELSSSSQSTEAIIGKYEVNDFILYHFLVNGDDSERIVYLLEKFMNLSNEEATNYVLNFNKRFYSQQFKRLTAPEAPKILNISLSPRSEMKLNGDIYRLNKKD